jgi:antitoxin (DNA-binding transcriptional repressor) of toxin-antitoxin stability system
MKIVNVRELRETIPQLKETLAKEGELLLVSNGQPVARLALKFGLARIFHDRRTG